MILKVHLDGAASYGVGHEIWQETLADAIQAEAETIASYAGSALLQSSDQGHRNSLSALLGGHMGPPGRSGERWSGAGGVGGGGHGE